LQQSDKVGNFKSTLTTQTETGEEQHKEPKEKLQQQQQLSPWLL